MRRTAKTVGWLLLAAISLLAVDYALVDAKGTRVSRAVSRLDGRMGSLPFWPLGAEYRITFSRALSDRELDSLAELNNMRGWVGVRFADCDLSVKEQRLIAEKLPSCHVFWDDAGTVVRLPPHEWPSSTNHEMHVSDRWAPRYGSDSSAVAT